MPYHAFSPDGTPITGQVQSVTHAVALVAVFNTPDASSEDSIDFAGETKVDWDSQKAQRRDGELLYEDEDGNTWRASQLEFRKASGT